MGPLLVVKPVFRIMHMTRLLHIRVQISSLWKLCSWRPPSLGYRCEQRIFWSPKIKARLLFLSWSYFPTLVDTMLGPRTHPWRLCISSLTCLSGPSLVTLPMGQTCQSHIEVSWTEINHSWTLFVLRFYTRKLDSLSSSGRLLFHQCQGRGRGKSIIWLDWWSPSWTPQTTRPYFPFWWDRC